MLDVKADRTVERGDIWGDEKRKREMCIFIVITKLFIYIKGPKKKMVNERGIEIERAS